jgi:hypothetical protein
MPSVATVIVLTGSFMTPRPIDIPQQIDRRAAGHVVGDLADELMRRPSTSQAGALVLEAPNNCQAGTA